VLAQTEAEVLLTGRNDAKGRGAVAKIRSQIPGAKISYETLDLASLASVTDFAKRFAAGHSSLDLLINNAGVMALPTRQTTVDGFEMQFGTNYLGHYALTAQLLPLLRRGHEPRVVNLSSIAHRTGFIHFSDLQGERLYSPWKAYNQSKLAMLMFALELQRRSDAGGWNLMSNAAHPGWARTDLITNGPGTAMTSGKARSHYGDGEIREVSYAAGDTKHHVYAPGEFMTHDLENIGDTPLIFATVEFLHSANAPLEVEASESPLVA
jgi:NAD(P)-dependent dehydrogenase (short-subunit alcohol dehydrogenase family)